MLEEKTEKKTEKKMEKKMEKKTEKRGRQLRSISFHDVGVVVVS